MVEARCVNVGANAPGRTDQTEKIYWNPPEHTNPGFSTLCPLRALCQSSQPNRSGPHRGLYEFIQWTETKGLLWKETRLSRWSHWTPSVPRQWVKLYCLPLRRINFITDKLWFSSVSGVQWFTIWGLTPPGLHRGCEIISSFVYKNHQNKSVWIIKSNWFCNYLFVLLFWSRDTIWMCLC